MEPSLDDMVEAASRGDARAWRAVIDTCSGRVYGLLLRRCGDSDLAEEMTQAAFVRVFIKLKKYKDEGKFEAWLFRVALNQLRDEQRRRRRYAMNVDFSATPPESLGVKSNALPPEHAMQQQELAAKVNQAVALLGEADRQIVEMRFVAELTFTQIADVLDEPLGTVLARGHRAIKKLREIIGTDPQDERS